MPAPLYEAIQKYNKKAQARFHTPGHKGRAEAPSPLQSVLPFDLTELPDTGSLFDGLGPTAEAEALAARLFGSAATLMSAGGCSLCIQTMLRLAFPRGGKLICGRILHRSAVHAMALLRIDPLWVLPDTSAGTAFSGRITAEAVQEQLERHPDAGAVYLTSPDYCGMLSDIRAIAAAAAEYGVPVLVDCAQGAHLKFLNDNLSPLSQGAAVSAESAHKTLPVLTGGAWLHLARELPHAREAMALFASTSPSYFILLSLDLCRQWLEDTGGTPLRALAERTASIKALLRDCGFVQPEGPCDPLRLAFSIEDAEAAGHFLREAGAEPEYAGAGTVILIPSAANTEEDFQRLEQGIQKLAASVSRNAPAIPPLYLPEQVLTPAQAFLAETQRLPLAACLNRVAAAAHCPCPPGVPLVMPGERIDAAALAQLEKYGVRELDVVKSAFI